jgi:hypothetical protein
MGGDVADWHFAAKADIDQPSLIRHDEGSSRRRFDFRSIEAINTPKDFNAE